MKSFAKVINSSKDIKDLDWIPMYDADFTLGQYFEYTKGFPIDSKCIASFVKEGNKYFIFSSEELLDEQYISIYYSTDKLVTKGVL